MVNILHQADVEAVVEAKYASLIGADTATTAELASLTATVNTTAKKTGKQVFNVTTSILVVAAGATAASVWNTTAGVLAHTPV